MRVSQKHLVLTIRLGIFLTLVMLVVAPVFGQKRPESVDSITGKIVGARDLTAQYVILANKKLKPDSAEWTEAFKLYADAYSTNNAWNAYVASALRAGRGKKLNNNDEYDEVADTAKHSALAFTNFVDSKTKLPDHELVTIISSLADLGVKLWTNVKTQLDKQRETSAKNFETATKWKSWDEILAAPAPNTPIKPEATKPDTPKPDTPKTDTPKPGATKPGTTKPAPK